MMRASPKKRAVFYTAVVLSMGASFVLYLLQSNWLKDNIRHRIITAVQSATGGQVELRAFRFHWHLLTAEIDGFIVHGTESGQDAPLFRADSVRARLQIASLLRRDVRVASLTVEAPQLHLLLRADGTTNIPGPSRVNPHQVTEQLLRLKLQQVRLNSGLIQINDQRIPLDLTARDIALALLYNGAGPYYALQFASPAMDVRWAKVREMAGSVQVAAQLAQDQLILTKTVLRSGDSQIELNGSLHHFAQPVIRWNVQSRLAVSQLAAALHIEDLRGGTVNINGSGYRDLHTPFSFSGEMNGQHLSYFARKLLLKDLRLKSKLIVDKDVVRLPDLDVAGPNVQWKGKAELTDYRKISLRGELIRLDLRTVATAVRATNPGWSGTVRGPVDADGLLR
ncbi:MAG: hypothetical protein ACJ73N_14970, partial [Bryobacteraceae bacterium]